MTTAYPIAFVAGLFVTMITPTVFGALDPVRATSLAAAMFAAEGETIEVRPVSSRPGDARRAVYAVADGRYRRLPIRCVAVPPA